MSSAKARAPKARALGAPRVSPTRVSPGASIRAPGAPIAPSVSTRAARSPGSPPEPTRPLISASPGASAREAARSPGTPPEPTRASTSSPGAQTPGTTIGTSLPIKNFNELMPSNPTQTPKSKRWFNLYKWFFREKDKKLKEMEKNFKRDIDEISPRHIAANRIINDVNQNKTIITMKIFVFLNKYADINNISSKVPEEINKYIHEINGSIKRIDEIFNKGISKKNINNIWENIINIWENINNILTNILLIIDYIIKTNPLKNGGTIIDDSKSIIKGFSFKHNFHFIFTDKKNNYSLFYGYIFKYLNILYNFCIYIFTTITIVFTNEVYEFIKLNFMEGTGEMKETRNIKKFQYIYCMLQSIETIIDFKYYNYDYDDNFILFLNFYLTYFK